ncbi:MAG: hypothetical protein L3J00_03960 [Thiomicrorhabdus sp.]|nr:hypothetical protein [Thiomicrorhabdus sp.]
MTGFKSLNDVLEEPVLTRLISSDGFATSKVETWQPNRFDLKESHAKINASERSSTQAESVSEKATEADIKEEVQKVELLTKEAYELASKEGYQAGLEKGLSEGAEQGRVEAKALALQASDEALSPKLAQMDALLLLLKQPYDQLEKQVFSELTELALHIAERVTQKEVSANKTWVLEAIEEAIKTLPDDSKPFSIELHTKDLKALKSLNHSVIETWDMTENTSLLQGTCLVKQENSSILNSWKNRFDEAVKHLI